MKKSLALTLAITAALGGAPFVLAQSNTTGTDSTTGTGSTTSTDTTVRTDRTQDRNDPPWGLIGLAGLAGLAGLGRKAPTVYRDGSTSRDGTTR